MFSDRFLQNFRLTATKFFSNLHQPVVIKQSLEIFIDLSLLFLSKFLASLIITRGYIVNPSLISQNSVSHFHPNPILISHTQWQQTITKVKCPLYSLQPESIILLPKQKDKVMYRLSKGIAVLCCSWSRSPLKGFRKIGAVRSTLLKL